MQFAHDFKTRALAAPDRILVATDLSDTEFLIPYAIAQAKESGAEVTLLYVVSPILTGPIDPSVVAYVDLPKIKEEARLVLEGAASRFQAQGIKCKTMIKDGFPGDVIQEVLEYVGADRLIIGTHGRVRLERLMLGSVTTELLSRVTVPMYVVGRHARGHKEEATPRRILHPVSLRHPNSTATAFDIAQHCRAELTLLHVVDPDEADDGSIDWLVSTRAKELAKLAPDSKSLSCPMATQVKVGERVHEILDTAASIQADLIVLGVSASMPIWPLKGSRTAYRVIANADCPVLTIRHDAYVDDRDRERARARAAYVVA
jgi:nucleotide-binding universal stress UspA family protein